jgi:GAF domain-containing protein
MLEQRIAELERQVAELLRRDVPVAARADGAEVVTEDSGASARVIRLVLSELRKEVPYDSCSVQELRGQRLVIIGGVGFADLDVILGESFDVDNIEIPNGEVIYRRRPLIVGDTEQYRAFRRGLHVGAGIRSWLGVPLLHGDRVYGMLALDKAEPDYYTASHQQTALAFARLVASALAQGNAQAAESSA